MQAQVVGSAIGTCESSAASQLDVAFTNAGLHQNERYIIAQRLQGRSYADIARDTALGRVLTKQAIHKAEASALRKLGVHKSLEQIVRQTAAADAMDRAPRVGRDFDYRELFSDCGQVAQRAREEADAEERRLDAWVDYLTAVTTRTGRLTPDQSAEFDRRIRAGERAPSRIGRPRR
jgi:hypothetical protein